MLVLMAGLDAKGRRAVARPDPGGLLPELGRPGLIRQSVRAQAGIAQTWTIDSSPVVDHSRRILANDSDADTGWSR